MGRARLAAAAVAAAVAGLAGGAGGLVMGATPASAASGPPFVTINPVGDNGVASTPTPTISGTVTPGPGRITAVDIQISSSHGTAGFSTSATPPGSGQSQWTFSGALPSSQALAWNGPYQVVATATQQDPGGSTHQGQPSPPRDFAEGVPPQAPTGVSATKDANGSAVTVSWQANPEPDIVGYEVQRTSVNGSNWSTVSPNPPANETNYQDTSVQQGSDYQYHVIAVRSGAQSGQTIASGPSAPASTVAPPASSLFGPGGSVLELPAAIQAITDPVAGLVHPGQGPGGPVTGSPTSGGYSNLPYGGQAALTEPGTPGAQDPKGRPGSNIVRTALFVAAALILLAIAAHLIRMRRAVDDTLAPVGVDQWDRHTAGVDETSQMATVGSGRGASDVTRAMAAQQGGPDRPEVTRAVVAQRRR